MIALDIDSIEREAVMRACGTCGEDSEHFRACADCGFVIARCKRCGGNKSVSRTMRLHINRWHVAVDQRQVPGIERPIGEDFSGARPKTRAECAPCDVCEEHRRSGEVVPVGLLLPCGHSVESAANHCRPCAWVGCRHHLLIEIAKHEPKADENGNKRDARPTTARLNKPRRPGELGRRAAGIDGGTSATTNEVFAWLHEAVEHIDCMGDSCSLDVADANPDGFSLVDCARLLGVTTAAIKEEVACAEALRDGLVEYEDHVPEDHTGLLARAQER